jgi:hypothetical protein
MSEEEIATETEQELQESQPEIPPPPPPAKRAPRRKAVAERSVPAAPFAAPLKVDADFWGELLATSRAQDRAARATRFSNLVQFK